MLDMGFIHDVKKIISLLPVRKQTLLFSATMPAEIQALTDKLLHNPARVEVTPCLLYTSYVNAWLSESYFVCGDKRGSDLDGLTASFITIWNPAEVESNEKFHEAFTQVVNGIRDLLGNPYVWITIEDIELSLIHI